MNLPLFVGIRYSGFSLMRKAGGNRYLSFISTVSLLGLALGVVALIVVVSVMNGFDSELKERILGAMPHVVIAGNVDEMVVARDKRIKASAAFLARKALIFDGNTSRLIVLHGIEPGKEALMSRIPEHMNSGLVSDLAQHNHGVIIGEPLAYRLNIDIGDYLTVVVPEPKKDGNTVVPRVARLKLIGTFRLGSELDYRLALMNVSELQKITRVANVDTTLRLNNIFNASAVKQEYRTNSDDHSTDWTVEFGDFFETVKMEKVMMFVLLSLIVAIAAFNIVSSLSMMVKDKQRDIAVLRSFGLSPGQVMAIFIIQGMAIACIGVLLGSLLGLLMAYNITDIVAFFEAVFGQRVLSGTYFDAIPSDVRMGDIFVIIIVTMLISISATIYPAWRAASLMPAAVLKSE